MFDEEENVPRWHRPVFILAVLAVLIGAFLWMLDAGKLDFVSKLEEREPQGGEWFWLLAAFGMALIIGVIIIYGVVRLLNRIRRHGMVRAAIFTLLVLEVIFLLSDPWLVVFPLPFLAYLVTCFAKVGIDEMGYKTRFGRPVKFVNSGLVECWRGVEEVEKVTKNLIIVDLEQTRQMALTRMTFSDSESEDQTQEAGQEEEEGIDESRRNVVEVVLDLVVTFTLPRGPDLGGTLELLGIQRIRDMTQLKTLMGEIVFPVIGERLATRYWEDVSVDRASFSQDVIQILRHRRLFESLGIDGQNVSVTLKDIDLTKF